MVKKLQVVFFILAISILPSKSNEHSTKTIDSGTIDLGKLIKLEDQKYLLTPPKKTIKIFQSTLNKINTECCDNDFPNKNRLEDIKETLQKCLTTNCEKKLIPIYSKKNPPLKLTAFKMNTEVNDLLLEHGNFKYNKISKKLSSQTSETSDKDQEIQKLKETVDKMLKNYQVKISNLEKENKELSEKFDKAYKMLPKVKQKKFDEN